MSRLPLLFLACRASVAALVTASTASVQAHERKRGHGTRCGNGPPSELHLGLRWHGIGDVVAVELVVPGSQEEGRSTAGGLAEIATHRTEYAIVEGQAVHDGDTHVHHTPTTHAIGFGPIPSDGQHHCFIEDVEGGRVALAINATSNGHSRIHGDAGRRRGDGGGHIPEGTGGEFSRKGTIGAAKGRGLLVGGAVDLDVSRIEVDASKSRARRHDRAGQGQQGAK